MYLNNTTVMYVEDDLATQKLIEKILNRYCKEVFVANDGVEGLALYKKILPNIVLSDIVMPNMNGIKMSEKIRELNPKQIISLFTAYNEPEFKEKALELNIDAYIMKPLDEKQFFTSLNYLAMAFHTDIEIKKEI
jgi:CheY-like chemotaxis protein